MNPESEAEKLLQELGITTLPVIPRKICKKLDIEYIEKPFKSIDGLLLVDSGLAGLIAVNSLIEEEGRKNFTCAHELGHYCMDSIQQKRFECSREILEGFNNKIPYCEIRANMFATEFLMPKFIYQRLVDGYDPVWDHIKELANLSRTSLISTARRFIDLTDKECVLVVSRKKMISYFFPSKEFKPFVQMDSKFVSPDTVAYSALQGNDPPDCFELVKADNWVSGRGVNPYTDILEWSLPVNSYGEVYTILFDEEGIEGWDNEYHNEDEDIEWEPPTFHKSKMKK